MDHYEVLGVPAGADDDTIRRAYLALARRHHPDGHAGANALVQAEHARKMQEINEAWAVLGTAVNRIAYDRERTRLEDPGVARRAAREPTAPPGKGWTPRSGDDAWMDDFEGWANERDELAPDAPRSTGSRVFTMLPVGLFAASVVFFALGIVMTARPLIALGAIAFAFSVALFVFLPMLEMTKRRGDT